MMSLLRRLLYLLRAARHDADLQEEIETHRSLRQAHLERQGIVADARTASRRALGHVTLAREDARSVWVVPGLEGLGQDLRTAVRSTAARPAAAVAAVLTLALGLGSTLVAFGLVDRIVLRPLDVPAPEQLVTVEGYRESRGTTTALRSMNWESVSRLTKLTTLPNAAIASAPGDRATENMVVSLAEGEPIRSARAAFVSADYFRVLGIMPPVGRDFLPDDGASGARLVAIVADRLWRTRFGARADIIGQHLLVNGSSVLVIGVAPASFTGTDLAAPPPDLFLPLMAASRLATDIGVQTDGRNGFFTVVWGSPGGSGAAPDLVVSPVSPVSSFRLVARIEPQELPAAQAELTALGGNADWQVRPLAEGMLPFESRRSLRRFLWLVAAAVGLTLLVSCVNLASLLLARAEERRAELAMKAVLGAGWGRLIQTVAVEVALLVLAGAAVGLGIALWADRMLSGFVLPGGVALASLRSIVDERVLLFGVCVTAVAILVVGIAPAMRIGRHAPALTVRDQATASPRLRISRLLLTVQVAASILFVFLASLFVQSVSNALTADLGFDGRNLFSASMAVPPGTFVDASATSALADRVRRIPGVMAASIGTVPLAQGSDLPMRDVTIDGTLLELSDPIDTFYVNRGYFDTMQIRIIAGRSFNGSDGPGALPVALVNEAAIARFWPGGDAIGHSVGRPFPAAMRGRGVPSPEFRIVGIVADVKVRSIDEVASPVIYLPRDQHEAFLAGVASGAGVRLSIRAQPDVVDLGSALAAVASESGLTFRSVTSIDETLERLLMPQRLGRAFLLLLGTTVVALMLVGVYGLTSCVVARGSKAIGIRLALGAGTRGVVRSVVRSTAVPVVVGTMIGTVCAWLAGAFVEGFLYGLGGSDSATLGVSLLTILAGSALAVVVPLRRALRISPVETLRVN